MRPSIRAERRLGEPKLCFRYPNMTRNPLVEHQITLMPSGRDALLYSIGFAIASGVCLIPAVVCTALWSHKSYRRKAATEILGWYLDCFLRTLERIVDRGNGRQE